MPSPVVVVECVQAERRMAGVVEKPPICRDRETLNPDREAVVLKFEIGRPHVPIRLRRSHEEAPSARLDDRRWPCREVPRVYRSENTHRRE